MRDIAVVSVAQHQEKALTHTTEVELMVPLINQARGAVGLTQDDIGFTCSGSSDFLAGQAFSFVHTLDAVGAVPPISESHVEMDGAWALYEAWVKLQIGAVDTALVYSYGKSSPGSLRDVLSTQLDPYYLGPLWPDAFSMAGLQARVMLESGAVSEQRLAEIAVRSLNGAADNPLAVRSSAVATVDHVLAEAPIADPLRPSDCAASADGGVAVVLAAGDRARELCDRPAWIKGIDHRIDPHQPGVRDLTRAPSAHKAAAQAGAGDDRLDAAELAAPFTTQEHILEVEMGLVPETAVNASGGALAGHTMMAAGLMRIADAAQQIHDGRADRVLGHAASGLYLQQNLVCVMEGE